MIRTVISPNASDQPTCSHHRLREDVVLVVAGDGSGRLLDLSGDVLAISRSGVRMLECALSQGIEDASRTLALAYSVDEARIRSDMVAFLASLSERRLLVLPGREIHAASTIVTMLSWLMAPAILACTFMPRRLISAKAHLLLATAFISTHLFGWSNAVRVWRWAAGPSLDGPADGARETLDAIDREVARALATHPLSVNCKERALSCHVLARAAGAQSRVIVGIDLLPFALHCWCESNARILADDAGNCDRFTPVLTYS
jgi:hypothetical protein